MRRLEEGARVEMEEDEGMGVRVPGTWWGSTRGLDSHEPTPLVSVVLKLEPLLLLGFELSLELLFALVPLEPPPLPNSQLPILKLTVSRSTDSVFPVLSVGEDRGFKEF